MRTFGSHAITYHAYRVQKWTFLAGVLFALAFIGFAVNGKESLALSMVIAGMFSIGASVCAWTFARKFK